ncbi:MAG TPA: IPT/TIG domain-containing protein, partial [Bacillota bacterium]|nr:IPT/TIG domain-containing protein [Bacillota bacterium]
MRVRLLIAWFAVAFLALNILPQASPTAAASFSSLSDLGCSFSQRPLTKDPIIVVPGTAASFLWGPNTLTHQGNWVYWLSGGQLSTNGIPPLAANPNSDLLRLKKNPDGSDVVPGIYVGDMFRWLDVGGNWGPGLPGWASGDVYYSLLAFLNCFDYTENDQFVQGGNGWLNVFPYDWRDSPAANGALLAQKVQQVLQSTGASKVILIAHSLGGLVARSYIAGQYQDGSGNTYRGGSKVAALIDIATPWLGTPRVTQAMTVGWNFGIPGMNPRWGQILAPNWPMVYAQSPTASGFANASYFTAYPEGFLTASLNNEQITAGDAAGQDAAIRSYNPQEYDEITQWRSQVFDGDNHGVLNYLIAGYNHPADETISLDGLGSNDTIDRLEISQHTQTCAWYQFWCDPHQVITDANVHLGPGDDTVPLGSALLGQMPAYPGPQGAGPVSVASSPIGAFTYYLVAGSDVAHMALPGNDRVLTDVRSILTGLDAATAPAQPKVTGLSPAVGDPSGGTSVIISGSGFTGATAVTFGGVAATGTVVSDSEIQVTAPPAPKGAGTSVDVQVQGQGGTSATGPSDLFTYDGPLQGLTITPTSGPAGTKVTITGSGLGSTTSVTFGSASAQFSVVSDSELTAVAPSGTDGTTVHVTVTSAAGPNKPSQWTRADGYVETLNDPQFTYNAGKTITVTTTTLPDAGVGQPYSQQLQASGGDGHFTWAPGQVCVSGCTQYAVVAQGESLTYGPATHPAGLTLDPNGTIHGTPTGNPTKVTFPVVVTDQSGDTAGGQVTFNVTESAATCAANPEPAPTDGSPVVTGVSPSTVADTGSQTITISGYNLNGTVGVTFAQPAANVYIAATGVQVEPDGSVKAVTPAG